MKDFVSLLGALGQNADKLGAIAILILDLVAIVYGLGKRIIVLGYIYDEKVVANKELSSALKEAVEEIDEGKIALTKLQVEKELTLGWQARRRSNERD
jgi:hypothetical protein